MSEKPAPASAAGRSAMKKELPEHFKAYKNVWVLVELEHGQVHPVSWELMGEGRKLADKLGVELAGVVIGGVAAGARDAVSECFAYGADNAYVVENPVLADYRNESYTGCLPNSSTPTSRKSCFSAPPTSAAISPVPSRPLSRLASPPIAPNSPSMPTSRSRRRGRPSAARCCARSTRSTSARRWRRFVRA